MTLPEQPRLRAQVEVRLSSNGAPAIAAIGANANLGFARRSQAALRAVLSKL
jgi:hypothetical protein